MIYLLKILRELNEINLIELKSYEIVEFIGLNNEITKSLKPLEY